MNESNFPCKCGHFYDVHDVIERHYGWYEWLDDVGHEVWREEEESYPVCTVCDTVCYYEQMNNLEYLEWKNDNHKHK
jgi:hypothetical protein